MVTISPASQTGYYRSLGYPVEEMLVDAIAAADYTQGVIIQSFEADSLRRMAELRPDWPRVKLCLKDEVPNDPAELRSWLQEVSTYAQVRATALRLALRLE